MAKIEIGTFAAFYNEGSQKFEIHALGCKDLGKFDGPTVTARSGADAEAQFRSNGTVGETADVIIMPCTNPVRMRYIKRLVEVEVPDEAVTEEVAAPVAKTRKRSKKAVEEPVAEPTPELVPAE